MDIALDDNLDVVIQDGDWLIDTYSHPRHQQLILLIHPGELRQSPLLGVGIGRLRNEQEDPTLATRIRSQFKADNYRVDTLTLSGSTIINLEATYQP